ncbi:MAG: hypothetical protein U5J99_02405 [Parvularculaceae bacterium]|nr:hypothetical protein [Parvularculaceae bacterium]
MFGNGLANIVAAAIIGLAIVWSNNFGRPPKIDEKAAAEMYARAVGDIRNDIVINCGCCGEGEKKAEARPF